VVSISPATPLVADQRATSSASASGSLLFSSACGRSAWTERRASARLSRASRLALLIRRSRSSARPVLLSRLELSDDSGQALGQGVVDLPGHPLPLVPGPGLPGLGEQLGLQPGVLGDHLLQPVVRLGQLGDHALAGLVLLFAPRAQHGEQPDQAHVTQATRTQMATSDGVGR